MKERKYTKEEILQLAQVNKNINDKLQETLKYCEMKQIDVTQEEFKKSLKLLKVFFKEYKAMEGDVDKTQEAINKFKYEIYLVNQLHNTITRELKTCQITKDTYELIKGI